MIVRCHQRLMLCLLLLCVAAAIAVPDGVCTTVLAARAAEPLESECLKGCISVRGGSEEESKIHQFLSEKELSMEKFHVHGWRWHTMSLVREAGRLQKLAERLSSDDECAPLRQAADYVVGFNMKGLHKIEAGLFFPWMRQKLTSIQQKDLASAFGSIMDGLENDRKKIALLAIAEVVPESEQKSFNNKVLRNLGLLDSRLHLVHMHEAVWESNIEEEKDLFLQSIPTIPQKMIPRWKRNLYLPRTSVLE
eukprot:scaffold3875_cov123-Cylindrotheca_fusiformis.AAC.23